ncbi:MAG: hypothetical protein CM15mP41_2210 [Flammeovirgaceae bacterium]|nr:MAG: hypothetical protein CM15mP41_2210 [Flammeovirgaceae bacterium]
MGGFVISKKSQDFQIFILRANTKKLKFQENYHQNFKFISNKSFLAYHQEEVKFWKVVREKFKVFKAMILKKRKFKKGDEKGFFKRGKAWIGIGKA